MTVTFLDRRAVDAVHQDQVERYGGALGVRDVGALESALAQPMMSAFGQYLHADVFQMASAYCYHLVMNHPYLDGNKRVGTVAALVFLRLNGFGLDVGNDTLADFVLEVAQGKVSKEAVAAFFKEHAVPLADEA